MALIINRHYRINPYDISEHVDIPTPDYLSDYNIFTQLNVFGKILVNYHYPQFATDSNIMVRTINEEPGMCIFDDSKSKIKLLTLDTQPDTSKLIKETVIYKEQENVLKILYDNNVKLTISIDDILTFNGTISSTIIKTSTLFINNTNIMDLLISVEDITNQIDDLRLELTTDYTTRINNFYTEFTNFKNQTSNMIELIDGEIYLAQYPVNINDLNVTNFSAGSYDDIYLNNKSLTILNSPVYINDTTHQGIYMGTNGGMSINIPEGGLSLFVNNGIFYSFSDGLTMTGSDGINIIDTDDSGISIRNSSNNSINISMDNIQVTSNSIQLYGDSEARNNLSVYGDLILYGNVLGFSGITNVDITNLSISDNIIMLNKNETGSGITYGTSGIEIERGTLSNSQFIFDESTDTFKHVINGQLAHIDVPTIPINNNNAVSKKYLDEQYMFTMLALS